MDLEVDTYFELEGISFQDEDDIDCTVPVNQGCGICMDDVIDRGVLDCCQHWFCFACIDNWATITNLCPLCKLEFQTITCLPVYDTIGSLNAEEHPISQEDDWCIQGINNTLSFPSYYIDEDAVICLDGDGCKIRSGLSTSGNQLTIDTSIACDSCDIWYHAFCVGFNPECTSESSWLCPRCIADEVSRKSDGIGMSDLKVADIGWLNDSPFSSKVSISLADAGETAIVVSMIEGKQMIEASGSLQTGSLIDLRTDGRTEASVPDLEMGNAKTDMQLNRSSFLEPIGGSLVCSDEIVCNTHSSNIQERSESIINVPAETAVMQPSFSLLAPSTQGASREMTVPKQEYDLRKTSIPLPISPNACFSTSCAIIGRNGQPDNVDGYKSLCPQSHEASDDKGELSEVVAFIDAHSSASVLSTSLADRSDKSVSGYTLNTIESAQQMNFESNYSMGKWDDNYLPDDSNVDSLGHQSRKREWDMRPKMETGYSPTEQKPQKLHSKPHLNSSFADYRSSSFKSEAVSANSNLCSASKRGHSTPDIMNIVKEKKQRCQNVPGGTTTTDKVKGKRDGASRLRVKKIMRRAGEKKEASILIDKLREEIREAVGNKTSNIIGKEKVFTGELLTAFRAAVAKPQKEVVRKPDPSCLRMRKQSLVKGKSRENLTRKIYATSTGRRKRAWDREWEIEFWKHRCTRTRPEKVETLQSVLKLLKKLSGSVEKSNVEQDLETEGTNSILSRVFLADASVFPRKDDTKPLSILEGCPAVYNSEERKENDLCRKASQPVDDSISTQGPKDSTSSSDAKAASSDDAKKASNTSILKKEKSFRKGQSDGGLTKSNLTSRTNSSKESTTNSKELTGHSDKRKWALEVLARKNALTMVGPSNVNQEDRSAMSRNFPLLAQLPLDIRPVLTPSRQNKVRISVRQTQLYRITEYYLRRANMPVIRRTAETELAVADAVNVEREIFERSNSKLVYINLCSQFLAQDGKTPQTVRKLVPDSETTVMEGTGHIEVLEPLVADANTCSNKEEALKMAGLSSDSPSNSPFRTMQDADEEGSYCHSETTVMEGTGHIEESEPLDVAANKCNNVEEALKMAGLLSDSSSNSPYRTMLDTDEGVSYAANVREDVIGNVLDTICHSELEIYRDFEYAWGNGGYTVSSSMADLVGVSQPETGDSKIKLQVPAISCRKSGPDIKNDNNASKFPEKKSAVNVPDDLVIIQGQSDASNLIELQMESCGQKACTPAVVEECQEELTKEPSLAECEEFKGTDKEQIKKRVPEEMKIGVGEAMNAEAVLQCSTYGGDKSFESNCVDTTSEFNTTQICANNLIGSSASSNIESSRMENTLVQSLSCEDAPEDGKTISGKSNGDTAQSVSRKVEAYVKEHIRPLCKSGVISVEQYRWAVAKTTEKVMKFHCKAKNANFLIKEGEKVKKLAEQYVEAAHQKEGS